jgi:hypothetical protein
MEEIMGARFVDAEPTPTPAATEAPAADAPAKAEAAEAPEGAEQGQPEEAKEGEGSEEGAEKEEKPKAWKAQSKGPPETVPYKVLSERTAQFRQREAELLAQIEAAKAGKSVPSEQPAAQAQAIPEAGFTPQDLGMPPEPSPDGFDTLADYERAVRQWDREFAKRETLAEMQQSAAAREQDTQMRTVVQGFEERLATARQADPEIAEIESYLEPAAPHLHPMVRQALLQSDAPGAMLRHIAELGGSLQEIVHRVNANPVGVLMELGRLAQPAVGATQRQAPPPIPATRTVSGGRGLKSTDPVESMLGKMGVRFND